MPTNEQRRKAAKRKLERQIERRAERARRRRQRLTIGAVVAVVVVIAAGVGIYVATRPSSPGGGPGRRVGGLSVPRGGAGVASGAEPRREPAPDRRRQPDPADLAGRHPADAGPGAGAVRGERRDLARPAGLLQRHPVPPAHHRRGAQGAAVRRPDRLGVGRARLPLRRGAADEPRALAAGPGRVGLRPRTGRDGQDLAARTRRAASSSSSTPTRRCRRSTPWSGASATPGSRCSTRSPRPAATTPPARVTASPSSPSRSPRPRSRGSGRPPWADRRAAGPYPVGVNGSAPGCTGAGSSVRPSADR